MMEDTKERSRVVTRDASFDVQVKEVSGKRLALASSCYEEGMVGWANEVDRQFHTILKGRDCVEYSRLNGENPRSSHMSNVVEVSGKVLGLSGPEERQDNRPNPHDGIGRAGFGFDGWNCGDVRCFQSKSS